MMRFFLFFSSILFVQPSFSQLQPQRNSEKSELLEFTLEAPFTSMLKDFDKKEFSGALTKNANAVAVEVRFKGSGRRGKCKFPNLRVDVEDAKTDRVKASLRKIGLEQWTDFQILAHCGGVDDLASVNLGHIEDFDQYMLRECMVYKFNEALGAPAFKTQLVKIIYKDTESDFNEVHLACLQESKKSVAKRISGYKEYFDFENDIGFNDHGSSYNPANDYKYIDDIDLFPAVLTEFFAGNGDWGTVYWSGPIMSQRRMGNVMITPKENPQNKDIKTLEEAKQFKFVPIVYDFDLGSLVGFQPESGYDLTEISPIYPDANNFNLAEVRYLIQKLRAFPKETLSFWIPKVSDSKFRIKLRNIVDEMPFDELSRRHVSERIEAVLEELRPEKFYRPMLLQQSPIYTLESDELPICYYSGNDIISVVETHDRRSKITLHVINEERIVCSSDDPDFDNSVLLNKDVWVDNQSITRE